jgi:tetratricopeptide (TPR) repeat protein
MKEIKAFVGHSFTEGDEQVVRKFTDYFDSVACSHPQFSWESAEKAEPRILTEKVLRLIEDKNTFIGICTRKELATPADRLRPLLLQPSSWKIGKAELTWKTSDWIIQEIGLAIGRRLNVILLVEEGVRDPGGLQGDIEYIPFNRAAPEKAFGKILEMLSTLSPRATTQPPAVSDPKPSEPPSETATAGRSDTLPAKPNDSWTIDTYEMAAIDAIFDGDENRLAELTGSYKATADGSQSEKASAWDAFLEYLRLDLGKGGKLQRLKEIAEGNPNSTTMFYLARGYASFDQHNASADTFARGHALAKDRQKKANNLHNAIEQYLLGGQVNKSRDMLKALRALVFESPSAEPLLLRSLVTVAEREKDRATELAVLERMVELQPDDSELRFSLAYKYGEQGRNDLSLYHYLMIPADERSPSAWNNIGATLDQLGMPAKSVDAYKQAAERNETLAMSNLGYKLMNAGFIEDALAEYKKAIALEKPHKNVGQLFSSLQSVSEKENGEQRTLIDEAKKRTVFLQRLGAAVGAVETADLGESWQGPDCVLTCSFDGNTVKLEGSFDRTNPFAGILSSLGSSPAAGAKVKHKVTYSGKVRGRAVFGVVSSGPDGAASDLGLNASAAYMFFSEDHGELYVMAGADTDNPTYQRLRKVELLSNIPKPVPKAD